MRQHLRGVPMFKLGYRPSPAGPRARRAPMLAKGVLGPVPAEFSLLQYFPGIRDQGQEGCCTGFATSGVREILHGSATGKLIDYRLSPAYLYARTRMAEGSFPRDAGATMADEFACLQSYGVCPEQDLPYNADPAEGPTVVADAAAVSMRIGEPAMVPMDPTSIKSVIAAGQPIGIAIPVYESFEQTGLDGKLAIPDPSKEAMLGGHGIMLLGYDANGLLGANQWGTSWGDQGFFHMPWGYESFWWEAWTATPVI